MSWCVHVHEHVFGCSLLCLCQLPNRQLERVQLLPIEEQTVACRCSMFENFAVLVTPCINRVVEFAKRVPGN